MKRMKWRYDAYLFRLVSSCGRFEIQRGCRNPKWSGYWSLFDTKTQTEYPCRSEQSAKTGARNILIADLAAKPAT